MKIIFAILLLALAGCTRSEQQTPHGYQVCVPGNGCVEVKLIVIEDGTRCAVLIGQQKAGLSCDWEGNRK